MLIRGGRVIILCRNEAKMEQTIAELSNSSSTDASVEGILMDLKSFESVRKAADQLRQTVNHIDILVLNAGKIDCLESILVPFELKLILLRNYESSIRIM